MSSSEVTICSLYPDLLGTYGDGGNATVLLKRLLWRSIPATVVEVNLGEPVPESCDIYLMGGGEDQPQTAVAEELSQSRSLHKAVERGATVLAICAGMQVLGNSFAIAGDQTKSGLGILDITTVRGTGKRRVGELVVQPSGELNLDKLSGFENHGGVTQLGPNAKPLGQVIYGVGNGDDSGAEGAVQGKIIGTYLHGPALARNPQLADLLLSWATNKQLSELEDSDCEALRVERFASVESRREAKVSFLQQLLKRA